MTDGQLRLVPGSRISVKEAPAPEVDVMNLAALFIKRPITTTLIMLGIVVFGVMSYRRAAGERPAGHRLPDDLRQASLPGASPETMASAVALPLEKQFSTISGLDSMNSTSTQGSTNITLQFDSEPGHRRRRPGRAVDDREGGAPAAVADAGSAVVPEGQSRRLSGPVPDAAIGHAAAHRPSTSTPIRRCRSGSPW